MSEKEPINKNEQDFDSSGAAVSNIEDSDDDEESSDHEGEKEQYISLPLYMQSSKDGQKKLRTYQLKDPLEEKGSKTEVTAPIKELAKCGNDNELSEHISLTPEDEAALHVCPHCPFKSRQLIEWINHKVVCTKENPVSAVASESVVNQSTSNPQKVVVLNSLKNQDEQQPQIKPAETEQSVEENIEVRKPLIKVKPEFNINSFGKNLANNKQHAEALVINCYQSKSGLIKLDDSVNPFIRKKCNVTVKKITKMNNYSNELVVKKEIKILAKKPNHNVKKYDILKEDILETIKEILSHHSLTDHNYNKIDFLRRLGITERRWNDTEIMQLIAELRKLASRPLISNSVDHIPQEEIVAYNLMNELEYLLKLRAKRKIEMSHIKAKAGMLGGATKRIINTKLRIENFLNIKLECPDDTLELPLHGTVKSINNLKRPLPPNQERNVNVKKPLMTSILKRPLPNQENNIKEPLHHRINVKIPVNHEKKINNTIKKPIHQGNTKKPVNHEINVNNPVKKSVHQGNNVKKLVNRENNVNNTVKNPAHLGNNVKKLVNRENNVNNTVKKPAHLGNNVKKLVNRENNVNNTVKNPAHLGNNVKKLVNRENNVNNTVKNPAHLGNINNEPVPQDNNIEKSTYQQSNANDNLKKSVQSNSKLEVDKSEILHTCKKTTKRKARHRYVGKIGYWSRVKGGIRKKKCAACLKNSEKQTDG